MLRMSRSKPKRPEWASAGDSLPALMMAGEKGDSVKGYKYIRAWGMMLHSFPHSICNRDKKNRKAVAPPDGAGLRPHLHIADEEERDMSKYDSIKTAAELVAEVQLHGLSTDQEDICRAQDIFGSTPVYELALLANDIGRDNADGKPDPKGTWSSGRKGTQGTFYTIVSAIWHWEEVTRFWNQHTNPEKEELLELRSSCEALKQEASQKSDEVTKEHELRLAETSEKLKLKEEAERLGAELHDRDVTIMELKAKLYDLMVERKDAVQ